MASRKSLKLRGPPVRAIMWSSRVPGTFALSRKITPFKRSVRACPRASALRKAERATLANWRS
eukprot:9665398-Alexandrium_andersonii.AAC.1